MNRFNFGPRWFLCVAVLFVVSTRPGLGQVLSDVALDSPQIGYVAPVCALTLLGAIGGAMIAPTEMQGAWATAGGTLAALVQVGLVYGTNRLIRWQTRRLEAALAQISFHLRLLPFPEADLWNDRHQFDRRVEKLIQWIETEEGQMAWNDFLKTPNGKFWSELLYHHSSQLHRYFDIIAEMEPQSCRSVVRIDHLVRKLTRYAGGLPLGRHAKDWKIIQAKAAKHEGT